MARRFGSLLFLLVRLYQIINPVTGKEAQMSETKKASNLVGNPENAPVCRS